MLRTLMAVLAENRFYADRVSAGKIASLEEFFARVPFTVKAELAEDQLRNPPYGSNLTYPLAKYTRFTSTSGTTGKPLRWLDTPESWEWMLDNSERIYQVAGVTASDRVFFAFSFGPFLGAWVAFEAAARVGCLRIPGGGMSSAARVRAILDTGATVLYATPSYAIRLAEVAAEEGLDLAAGKIRKVMTAAEPGGSLPATRAWIEKLWPGARVADHHGMTETGSITYPCSERPGVLHVMETAYIAEVIDPAGAQPVAAGGRGELVLTSLGRTGSPVLRYRTGDMVERAGELRCTCGSEELALVGGIVGRTDDMVVVRGVNVYPSALENIVRSCGGVAEYRVEIRTSSALTELNVQIEPAPAQPAEGVALAKRLEAELHLALGLRIPVTTVDRGTLPRFEMKSHRWIRR